MKNVDLFYDTGFDVINIPCSPELLYNEYGSQKISFQDINIIQTDWLGEITLELESNEARNIDYAIVEDEDTNERTCYIVDHYEMVSDGVCKLYMLLDAYNTMGGFEPGSENTVIAGSANRISVPLIHTDDGKFPTAEDNTFFTLEEPFQPSNRLVHQAIQLNPQPLPTPTATINKLLKNSGVRNNTVYGGEEPTGVYLYYLNQEANWPYISESVPDIDVLKIAYRTNDVTPPSSPTIITRAQWYNKLKDYLSDGANQLFREANWWDTDRTLKNVILTHVMPRVKNFIQEVSDSGVELTPGLINTTTNYVMTFMVITSTSGVLNKLRTSKTDGSSTYVSYTDNKLHSTLPDGQYIRVQSYSPAYGDRYFFYIGVNGNNYVELEKVIS